jgi:DNA phosphorothioation-associated putative methyltransferase
MNLGGRSGLGDDVAILCGLDFQAVGWDPVHHDSHERTRADIVNLGYVVNVIEDAEERLAALHDAWALADRLLLVSARLSFDARLEHAVEFGDGCLTRRNTFQKLYSQSELREWINASLGVQSLAAAPGVFLVFKDKELEQTYVSSRYRRRRTAPRVRKSDVLFEQHRELLNAIIEFVTDRARLPDVEELPEASALIDVFGSLKKAFAIVRNVTGSEQWDRIGVERRLELRLEFALERLGGRPRMSELAQATQRDVRALFSSYKKLCQEADELLFSAGDMGNVATAARESPIGKVTTSALYVHVDVLHLLNPVLRVYEGCARHFIGDIEGANLVKLNLLKPKVSYLFYPDFDSDPHPKLSAVLGTNLGSLDVWYRDYSDAENPFILHRKETMLGPDDSRHGKFERLTAQEERFGLLDDKDRIGTLAGWTQVLDEKGVGLRGHRVVRHRR